MSSPPRKRRSKRSHEETNHIEIANKTSDADFISRYMRPADGWTSWSHPRTGSKHTLSFSGMPHLSESELEACFEIIEETSGEDYRQSSGGWHPAAKRKEMRSEELRYILVTAEDDSGGDEDRLCGFTSMMPTLENGEPVVYIYEIHLRSELRGSGLGRQLISYAQSTASNIPGVGKVMLTCFKRNESGMQFYEKLGFSMDESSPRDRRLRGGKVVTSDYVILSWRGEKQEEGEGN